MAVKLTSTFFKNARGLTLKDTGGITWSINANTNEITGNASGGGASSGDPTAVVGLVAVNGSAATWMRSDGAPALDVTIAPTWTGAHTFSATGANVVTIIAANNNRNVVFDCAASSTSGTLVQFSQNASAFAYCGSAKFVSSGNIDEFAITTSGSTHLYLATAFTNRLKVDGINGNISMTEALGWNGAAPPAQVTGFGTPTGNVVVANYPGATATLVQTSNTVAEILVVMKAHGMIGA